jgi:hypothetical protein
MLHNSLNQRLVIGLFEFHKKGSSTYTKANNYHDVLAAFHLMDFASAGGFLSLLSSHTYLQQSNEGFEVVKLSCC